MRWILTLSLTLTVIAALPALTGAVETLSLYVAPGTTEFEYQGFDVRVETTGEIIVHLSVEHGEVVGQVDAMPGTRSATVTITVIDDPERVIFEGKVVAPSWFADYLPQETGRGEQ